MTCDSSEILNRVLFAGPDLRSHGGIASVMKLYQSAMGDVAYLPTTHHSSRIRSALTFAMALLKLPLYRLRGFRTLHAHGSVRGSWTRKNLLLDWAKILGMHTVHHIHNGALSRHFPAIGMDKVGRSLKKRDAVIALTHGWAGYLRKEFGLDNVYVIENPVMPTSATRKGHDDEKLRLLFLSNIDNTKGLNELLAAIVAHRDELEHRITLDIGGDGVAFGSVTDYISTHRLEPIVTAHGWVSGDPKLKLLESCDVFILPSYAEGQPMALLESMAAGLAVIVTPVGGMAEIVENGVNGLYVAPKDIESIFVAIRQFIERKELIAEMGQRNILAVKKFLPENIAAKVVGLHAVIQNKNHASEN